MLGIRPLLDSCFSSSWRPIGGFVVVFTRSLGYCLASFTLYTRLIDLDTASFLHYCTTIFFHSPHRLLSDYFLFVFIISSCAFVY